MRIAIVNDLSIAVESIRRVLVPAGHEVAWVARTGTEAVMKCAKDVPDLMLMDLIMPGMDGAEATRQIMAATPCPILVVTALVEGHTERVFEALGAGALDAVKTPVLGATDSKGPAMLLDKIEMLGRRINDPNRTQRLPSGFDSGETALSSRKLLVAVGASAGGPIALAEILGSLPADFPAAIVIVQHLDIQFTPGLADWLNLHSLLPVRLAAEGDKPTVGTVLLASTVDHLVLLGADTLGYTRDPVDSIYRPSVDVFFQSVAKHRRGKVAGVLLTGMGRDGAKGLKALREAGHHTIAQDRGTSTIYGMPKAAAALDAAVDILPLNQIGPALQKVFVSDSAKKAEITL
jgi:two-component system, chemotaxis family, response regulator WspF